MHKEHSISGGLGILCLQMPMTSGVMEWRLASLIARTEGIETVTLQTSQRFVMTPGGLIARTEGFET